MDNFKNMFNKDGSIQINLIVKKSKKGPKNNIKIFENTAEGFEYLKTFNLI